MNLIWALCGEKPSKAIKSQSASQTMELMKNDKPIYICKNFIANKE